ncbi:FAD-binding oxidoreductase [Humisphaera borealis]|uniref:FAD-binding protein n=1 Tax=Humisphaera borealis TaxID=2807512 RepID=A0A7M2WV43_9BACT|nr:FAD-linked oxidase C-terminal domain-containing protein [Humisphaera borealis]QOV89427.1 FAD-binding protein [Humisphaera borealis]
MPATASLIDRLTSLVPAGGVLADPASLFVYEADGFTIARARPAAVVFPTTTAQVVAVVKAIGEAGVQIVPRGSGTGLAGGCVAFENGVIVSTTRMNRILAIDLPNRVAHVEAGVRNIQLSDAVAAVPGGAPWHFAPDPSSQRASTIGGNASTNAGGIHTLKDFVSSNHVLGLEMVLPSGEVLITGGQNGCYESGHFDLPGLICGSEGTFGIITKLWVRLVPRATNFRTVVGMFPSTADACEAVSDVIAAGMLPAAMEMMDGRMIQVIEDAYHFGFPPEAAALILTEIDGIPDLLDAQAADVTAIFNRHHAFGIQTSGDPARRAMLWKARKQAFGAIGKISHSYCTQDACVPRSMLAQVLRKIDEIGREYGLNINNVFHAGDGNIHPIFLYDDRIEAEVQNTLAAAEKILQYCIDLGGTVTGEHGVGVEKIHLMPYLFDELTMAQFVAVKHAFDPEERINAGKLIPSDKVKITLLKPGRQAPQ